MRLERDGEDGMSCGGGNRKGGWLFFCGVTIFFVVQRPPGFDFAIDFVVVVVAIAIINIIIVIYIHHLQGVYLVKAIHAKLVHRVQFAGQGDLVGGTDTNVVQKIGIIIIAAVGVLQEALVGLHQLAHQGLAFLPTTVVGIDVWVVHLGQVAKGGLDGILGNCNWRCVCVCIRIFCCSAFVVVFPESQDRVRRSFVSSRADGAAAAAATTCVVGGKTTPLRFFFPIIGVMVGTVMAILYLS